jgi:predicted lactoylglutathione lyase
MIINDNAFVMLLVQEFFKTFTKKHILETSTQTETIIALSADTRDQVDELVNKAFAAGGKPSNDPMDQGPMYGWSFEDLDGHMWEVIYMDPSALQH